MVHYWSIGRVVTLSQVFWSHALYGHFMDNMDEKAVDLREKSQDWFPQETAQPPIPHEEFRKYAQQNY